MRWFLSTAFATLGVWSALALLEVGTVQAQAQYTWTVSASSTDPFVNTTSPVPGLNTFYVWLVDCDLPEPLQDGMSAAAFFLAADDGLTILLANSQSGFLNAGTNIDLVLAVGGCPCGPVVAAEIITQVDGPGTICFGTSILTGTLGATDCRSDADPEIWPIAWTGLGVGVSAPTENDPCVVVPPAACCLPDGTCLEIPTQEQCEALGGVFQGSGSDCAFPPCPVLTGACCLPGGLCDDTLTEDQCEALGGLFQGGGTDCSPAGLCDYSGACCLPDGSCDDGLTELECAAAGGEFHGVGSDCSGGEICPAACCLPDGSCDTVTHAECVAQGGVFLGEGTDCSTEGICDFSGACCLPDGSCDDTVAQAECIALGGTFVGEGTNCATSDCSGACCLPDGSCAEAASPADCVVLGGVFHGPGSDCASTSCPVHTGACCFPDGSCDDTLDETECAAAGGEFQGRGTDCGTTGICVLSGACCYPDGSCEVVDSESDCVDGLFAGRGTSCAEGFCNYGCSASGQAAAARRSSAYGWTISESVTNAFMNVGKPTLGPRFLYLWFSCSTQGGVAAAEFDLVSCDPSSQILGFAPMNGFLNAGGDGLRGDGSVGLLLAVGGCPEGPVVAGSILALDFGSTYCIALSPNGIAGVVDCDPNPQLWPFEWIGYSSDGTSPCRAGDASCLPIGIELKSWGQIKALYRSR